MINVVIAKSEGHYEDALSVRRDVFIIEQQIAPEEEIDELEDTAVHFIAYESKIPVGAGRMRIINQKGKAERICVLSTHRQKHVGQAVMAAIEDYARQHGLTSMVLNAQITAVPFYKKLNYRITSEEFMDAGIPHYEMQKKL